MQELAEEVFWLNLLAPVLDLPSPESEAALEKLTELPVVHPIEGAALLDLQMLRERLWWCRLADVDDIFAQWEAAATSLRASAVQPRPGSKTWQLVERTNARVSEFKQRRASVQWPGRSLQT